MTGASCQRAAERATSKTVPNGAPAAFRRVAALVVRTFRPAAPSGRPIGGLRGRVTRRSGAGPSASGVVV